MSQVREVICLTEQQIKTTLDNFCIINNLTNLTRMFNGKPSFTKDIEQKHNLTHITKFANNYSLYKASADTYNMYFITIEANKVDKLNILACSWFYHLIESDKHIHSGSRPRVYICPAYVISETILAQLPTNIIPCLYRFVCLTEIYPYIGSSNSIYGMVFNYKIDNTATTYMGKQFPLIDDGDIIVKILNALPGDIITAERIMNEVSVYKEYTTRQVINNNTDVHSMQLSGLCDGTKNVVYDDTLDTVTDVNTDE